MSFDEFTQYVKDNIKDFLPKEFADADVAIRKVVKNNDEKLCGLMIRRSEDTIVPTIYLEEFYKNVNEGDKPLESVMTELAEIHQDHMANSFDINSITDFDNTFRYVKSTLRCFRITCFGQQYSIGFIATQMSRYPRAFFPPEASRILSYFMPKRL